MKAPAASGLLGGSVLLLLTLNAANALHFVFHIAMARQLGAAAYGVVAALLAILYVMNVVAESIQTVVARYASHAPDPGRLHDLLSRAFAKGSRASLALLAAYLLAAVPLGRFLSIPYPLMALFALTIAGVVLLPIHRGALQGRKRFNGLGINMVLEVLVKLGVGIGLVWAGFREYGAVAGVGLGLCAALAVSFPPLMDVYRAPRTPMSATGIYRYSVPVFVATATVMAFYSLDVLLARAFFPAELAGEYAVASFLGKGILLGTMPIGKAMFPISTEVSARRGNTRRILAGALGLLVLCVTPVLLAFHFFPDLLVRLVAGKDYAQATAVLFPLGVAMSLMSVSNALLLYKLSTGRLRFYPVLPVLVLAEAAALFAFHATLTEYALAVAGANVAFLGVAAGLAMGPRERNATLPPL